MSLEFLITSLVVILAPGAGVLYTLAYGLSRGALVAAVAAFGCTLGIVPHLLAAVFGLAALLHASALAFQAVKVAGVIYLLYMAWSMLSQKGALAVDETEARKATGSVWGVAVRGTLVNSLNPKLSVFFLAFLPQFVSPQSGSATGQMIMLGAVFMAMTLVVFIGYGLSAAYVRNHIVSRPHVMAWLRRGFAATFIGFGARLALTDR